MPEKPLTVATYAAGASLAAITLFYVFAPNFFLDGDSNPKGKKGVVVGLSNPANDCFINSVLQALAGLTDLRIYLIRENHRRNIDEPWVYQEIVQHPAYRNTSEWKIQGLQAGLVTQGLKNILDSLNERPIYRKTISAAPFIRVLETAFKQRISRQQQDAQEFLQVVAERLCDEYHAGRRARQAAKKKNAAEASANKSEPIDGDAVEERLARLATGEDASTDTTESSEGAPGAEVEDEEGFPLEGKYESQIECQKCGFKTKPTESTFCTLTLNVPQSSSTSLNSCLDGFFKTEYVDDFKCEKCRLVYAKDLLELRMTHSKSESFKNDAQEAIAKLQHAIDNNPEHPPPDVELPPMRDAPTCRIAKHTRLTSFPKIMAIHLSRSIYNSISQKNSAKVSFPEQLLMGSLLNRKKYKLLGTVTHKGSHHSGHYESFRRQNVSIPFSTPNAFQGSMVFTKSATPSPASTPRVAAMQKSGEPSPVASTPDLITPSSGTSSPSRSIDGLPRPSTDSVPIPQVSSTSNSRSTFRRSPTSSTKDRESDTISLKSVAASARSTMSRISNSARNSRPGSPSSKTPVAPSTANGKAVSSKTKAAKPKRQKQNERWWRISDEKIKEAKTSEVLGMQREVYLLFYELDRESPAES
ncbi:cysteine proteinase [Annulohypoxylon bovei var. microspora]|nr:cysteine proteinase [Annulohypoxylon bovei var. microspora]